MRIIAFILSLFLFVSLAFAEDFYLPESANPKIYTIISDCYAHDDITFYTKQGRILGDYEDWKDIQIFKDGCFAKIDGNYFYAGEYFQYWNPGAIAPTIVKVDEPTFRLVSFESGITLGIDRNYIFRGNIAFRIPKGFSIGKLRIIDDDYITDGKTLYYFGSADGSLLRIENIDIPSFRIWRSPSFKTLYLDKNGLYIQPEYSSSKQRKTDPKYIGYIDTKYMRKFTQYDTSSIIDTSIFVYDKYNLYFPTDFPKIDIFSFQILPDYYSQDKSYIYSPTGKILYMIDRNDYEYIGNGIFRSHNKLYQGCQYEIGCNGYDVTGFDVATFHKTTWGFADKNGNYDIYLRSIAGKNLKQDIIPYNDTSSVYFHDAKNVYIQNWGGEKYSILTGSIYSTFASFSGSSYAKDSRSCWFEGIRFACNPMSFTTIEAWFAKDNKSVYYQTKKIPGADSKTFEKFTATGGYNWIETTHYSIDKNHVYYDDHIIQDANPKAFSLMKDLQSKDDRNIYYAGWKIKGVDYASYVPIRYSFARDKNHFYFAGIFFDIIKHPEKVKVISREKIQYEGKIQYAWCFNSAADRGMCE